MSTPNDNVTNAPEMTDALYEEYYGKASFIDTLDEAVRCLYSTSHVNDAMARLLTYLHEKISVRLTEEESAAVHLRSELTHTKDLHKQGMDALRQYRKDNTTLEGNLSRAHEQSEQIHLHYKEKLDEKTCVQEALGRDIKCLTESITEVQRQNSELYSELEVVRNNLNAKIESEEKEILASQHLRETAIAFHKALMPYMDHNN